MINSKFYKTLIKTSPKLSNEQLNYKKYYNNTDNAILMSLYLKKEWKTNEKKWIKL